MGRILSGTTHPLRVVQELALLNELLVDLVALAIGQGPLRLLQQLLGCHLSKALHLVLGQELHQRRTL